MAHDLHVRIGDDLWDFLRAYADANGVSITTALSVLLTKAQQTKLGAQATAA